MREKLLPKAILFDLDDTIISFDGVSDYAWEKTCKSFVQNEKTPFNVIELLESINKTRKWYWSDEERHKSGRMDMIKARKEIVKTALAELHFFNEDKVNEIADSYSKLQEELICLFPKSLETLKKLSDLGVRMVLITNGTSERQRWKIDKFKLSGFFEYCLIEEEIGLGKPDIRIFEIALQKLNLNAEEVWMVGDNLVWDIEAPKTVGIFAVWNDFRRKGLPKDSDIVPDRIINDISELII